MIHPPCVSREGVQRIQVIRIERGEVGAHRGITVRGVVVWVVVPRAEGHFAVPPGQLLPVRRPLDAGHPVQQVRRPPRDVDQDAVEPVAALERHQRLGERLRVEPDLVRREAGVEEVVAQRKLAHHRYAVRLLQLHGERHPFAAVHGVFLFPCGKGCLRRGFFQIPPILPHPVQPSSRSRRGAATD